MPVRSPRRHLVAVTCVAALLAGATSATAGASAAGDWPAPDYNAARSNANALETTLTTATVDQLGYQRSVVMRPPYGLCADAPDRNDERPVVVDDVMYALAVSHLLAVDLATGVELWRAPLSPTTSYRGLAVSGSRVVVGGVDCVSQSDPNGELSAYATATGARLWQVSLPILESVAVSGDRIVTSGYSLGAGFHLGVYDVASGAPVWSRTTNECLARDVLVVGGNVLATCGRPVGLAALALSDGHVVWRKPGAWRPAAGDTDRATATSAYLYNPAGDLVSVSPSTGAVRWTRAGERGPLHAVGAVRLFVTCDGIALCALDRATGNRLWVAPRFLPLQSVVVAADVVYPAPGFEPLVAASGAPIAMDPFSPDVGYPFGADQLVVAGGRVVATTSGSRIIDVYGLP